MNAQKLTLLTVAIIALGAIGIAIYSRVAPTAESPADLDLTGQPLLGNPAAGVEVVLFEDFLCSHCATFTDEILPRLERDYGDEVAFYFVNFPLEANFGPDSVVSAIAGECAFEQSNDAFWDYKKVLMRSQGRTSYSPDALAGLARDNVPELDSGELETCIEEGTFEARVREEGTLGESIGVQGTPTVFVNGQRVSPTFEALSAEIDRTLAAN